MLLKHAIRKAAQIGLAFTAITALLAGCGGGGGSSSTPTPSASTLGGVAAVGYPIVGATVQVVCAGGSALSTTTSSTGTWQVTFSGQTAPCAAQVSGGTINGAANTTNYHSISTTTGALNASPLTDLVVANLVGTATPSTWFAGLLSSPSSLSSITQTAVDAALAKLVAALPQLPLSANNPLTMTFSATPGTVGDDMLAALQTAMTNSATSYATLLGYASVPGFTAPAASFDTALTAAYAGTASGGSITTPATPTGVGATAISTTQINIAWTNVSGATSYNVYRSTSPNVQIVAGNKITSGTSTTSSPYADSIGLSASTTYYYKITAVNAAGESAASAEVSTTTSAASGGGSNTPIASIIGSFDSTQCQPGASATSWGYCGASALMDFTLTIGSYAPCTLTKVGGLLSLTQGAITHSATLDGTPADLIAVTGATSMTLQASDPLLGNYVGLSIVSGTLYASDNYSSWTPLSCY